MTDLTIDDVESFARLHDRLSTVRRHEYDILGPELNKAAIVQYEYAISQNWLDIMERRNDRTTYD